VLYVLLGALLAIPLIYVLLSIKAETLQWYVLFPMFAILCGLLLVEASARGRSRATRPSRC
jgi:hypothetical protein